MRSPPYLPRTVLGLVRVTCHVLSIGLSIAALFLLSGCTRPGSNQSYGFPTAACSSPETTSAADVERFLQAAGSQLLRFTSANSTLLREIRNARSARTISTASNTQQRNEQIVWETGDRFPTLVLQTHESSPTRVRLDPFLRKTRLSQISRIAISPDTSTIAVVARDVDSHEPRLIIIDHTHDRFETYSLAAYDLLWSDNTSLIVSTLENEQPTQVYRLTPAQPPQLVMTATNPDESLLLSASRDRSLFVVERASPTRSTLHLYTQSSATKPAWSLPNQLPGSRCTSWRGTPVCIVFADSPYGQVVRLNGADRQQREILYTGDAQNIPEHIDSDEEHLLVFIRQGTRTRLAIFRNSDSTPLIIESDGPVTTLLPAPRLGSDSSHAAVRRRSFRKETATLSIPGLVQPATISPAAGHSTCLDCIEEALEAPSIDGVSIPVSLVRPAQVRGLLVIAYGAYGVSLAAEHSPLYNSLLRAGIAVAIAHVRGGSERGPGWHLQAMAENKMGSVHDLLSVVTLLQTRLAVSPRATFLSGRSAGGWLVTTAALLAPSRIGGVILDAPLLDLAAAVSNPSVPLYHTEIAEWGKNPLHNLSVFPKAPSQKLPFDLLILLPLKDRLISPSQTARWAMAARCAQQPGAELLVQQLAKAGHTGTDSRVDVTEWEILQELFIRRSMQP